MHRLWHVAVLGSVLLAAAGLAILLVVPLVFERTPPGLRRARPLILAVAGFAAALLALEWLLVHGG